MLCSFTYDTIIGPITLAADDKYLKRLSFGTVQIGENKGTELIKEAYNELSEYLVGKRRCFTVPLSPEGTLFQKAVWERLTAISYGETRAYSLIADEIGNPTAARAVGGACNKNPIAIFIPCHRAVGKNGSLTGFAGGLETKDTLLNIEKSPNFK